MFYTVKASVSFDATHDAGGFHAGCGHRWDVVVHARSHYDLNKGQLTDPDNLAESLFNLTSPLRNRSLNDMLIGASPTPEGIASWVAEQLSGSYPDITEVEVSASYGSSITLHRDLRRPGIL